MTQAKFDLEITREDTVYGIIQGNETVVFIKAGAGGSHVGYEKKYLKMASAIHEKDGSTVICASNPSDEQSKKWDSTLIKEVTSTFTAIPVLKFIGTSRGAYLGLTHLCEELPFSKMLLINMPLMLNFHKSKAALKNKQPTFVYGELDPSAPYIPFLKNHSTAVVTIPSADHNFTDMQEEFLALIEYIL